MSTTFKNAPLVEIIAELRWPNLGVTSPQQTLEPAGRLVPFTINNNALDEFYMAFSAGISKFDFPRAERLVPPGFPSIQFQPVYRFRKNADPKSSVLYQLGPGLFSTNGLPPYKSWQEFSPFVKSGVETLLETRPVNEQQVPFSVLTLRYVDAFRPPLTKGLTISSFLTEILGIKIELPPSITKHLADGESVKPHLNLTIPMKNADFGLVVAEGNVNNEPAIILDFNVKYSVSIRPDINEIMGKFDEARSVLHSTFIDITKPLSDLMEPMTS